MWIPIVLVIATWGVITHFLQLLGFAPLIAPMSFEFGIALLTAGIALVFYGLIMLMKERAARSQADVGILTALVLLAAAMACIAVKFIGALMLLTLVAAATVAAFRSKVPDEGHASPWRQIFAFGVLVLAFGSVLVPAYLSATYAIDPASGTLAKIQIPAFIAWVFSLVGAIGIHVFDGEDLRLRDERGYS